MHDIWTLHEQNYGPVPSERLDELKAMERKHTPEQIEEAFGKARDANEGRGAPFGYVGTTLAKMGAAAAGQADSRKAPCERHGRLVFRDNLVARRCYDTVYAVCDKCAEQIDRHPNPLPRGVAIGDIPLTPLARLVEAYWQSVTGATA